MPGQRFNWTFICCLTTIFEGLAFAQESNLEGLTPEQIESRLEQMPQDQIDNLPVDLMIKAIGYGEELFLMELAKQLGSQYYISPSKDELSKWVSAFQKNIGEPETGRLTMGQMNRLKKLQEDLPPDVRLSGFHHVFVNQSSAGGKGTWEIVNERIADPLNIVNIRCSRSDMLCIETKASIMSFGGTPFLNQDTVYFDVISWTDNQVTSRSGSTTDCRNTTMFINSQSNEISQLTQNNDIDTCKEMLGEEFVLSQPRVVNLVSPTDQSAKIREDRTEIEMNSYSKEFQALIKEIQNKETSND